MIIEILTDFNDLGSCQVEKWRGPSQKGLVSFYQEKNSSETYSI